MITLKFVALVFFGLAAVAAVIVVFLGERLANLYDDIDEMGDQ